MSTSPTPSPFSTRFDRRVPRRWRPLWLAVKWSLGGLGAFGLVGNSVMKWGWPAAIWFLVGPFAYGVWQGLQQIKAPPPTAPPDSR